VTTLFGRNPPTSAVLLPRAQKPMGIFKSRNQGGFFNFIPDPSRKNRWDLQKTGRLSPAKFLNFLGLPDSASPTSGREPPAPCRLQRPGNSNIGKPCCRDNYMAGFQRASGSRTPRGMSEMDRLRSSLEVFIVFWFDGFPELGFASMVFPNQNPRAKLPHGLGRH